jgi:hypothetical protein
MENLQDVELAQTRCQNLSMSKTDHLYYVDPISPCQKSTSYNRLVMATGGVSQRGESYKVTRLTAIARVKMEDACIFCNVIKKI